MTASHSFQRIYFCLPICIFKSEQYIINLLLCSRAFLVGYMNVNRWIFKGRFYFYRLKLTWYLWFLFLYNEKRNHLRTFWITFINISFIYLNFSIPEKKITHFVWRGVPARESPNGRPFFSPVTSIGIKFVCQIMKKILTLLETIPTFSIKIWAFDKMAVIWKEKIIFSSIARTWKKIINENCTFWWYKPWQKWFPFF